MKRELKFRAWDLYNTKMIEIGGLESVCVNPDLDFANYKVMQYTGLNDKNGVEIYEGDIIGIKLLDNVEPKGFFICKCEVKFHKGCWCAFQVGFDYSKTPFDEITLIHREDNPIEVLGNIYE